MIYLFSNTAYYDDLVKNLKVCNIVFNKFNITLSKYDALVVTSKNAIKSLLANNIAVCDIEVYAILEQTAKVAKEFGFSRVFNINAKSASHFSDIIASNLENKNILYLRAQSVAFDLQKALGDLGIKIDSIEAYKNEILKLKQSQKPPKNSILIFASANNVSGFLANFTWDNSYKAVAIGESTAKALSGLTKPIISQKQSIAKCVEIAKNLLS